MLINVNVWVTYAIERNDSLFNSNVHCRNEQSYIFPTYIYMKRKLRELFIRNAP